MFEPPLSVRSCGTTATPPGPQAPLCGSGKWTRPLASHSREKMRGLSEGTCVHFWLLWVRKDARPGGIQEEHSSLIQENYILHDSSPAKTLPPTLVSRKRQREDLHLDTEPGSPECVVVRECQVNKEPSRKEGVWRWFTESYKKDNQEQLVTIQEAEVMKGTSGSWWPAS